MDCYSKFVDPMKVLDWINRDFFQAVAVLVRFYGCTIWTLMKGSEKKLYENYTRSTCCLEEILEAAPHKKGAVLLLAFYITNYPSKTNKTAREVRTNSLVTFSYGLPQIDAPVLTDKLRFSCISFEQTLHAVWSDGRLGHAERDGFFV